MNEIERDKLIHYNYNNIDKDDIEMGKLQYSNLIVPNLEMKI
jgi:hypothetical protein